MIAGRHIIKSTMGINKKFRIEKLFFDIYITINNCSINNACSLREKAIHKNINDLIYFSFNKNNNPSITNDV